MNRLAINTLVDCIKIYLLLGNEVETLTQDQEGSQREGSMSKGRTRQLAFVILCATFLMGCAGSSSTGSTPDASKELELLETIQTLEEAQQDAPLPFEGLWISEADTPEKTAQILVITRDSFYTLETYDPAAENLPPAAREMLAEIRSYDLDKNQITLRIQWFRTNGVMGGFNSPTALVTYSVTEDTLQIAISRADDGLFPENPDPRVYFRK